MLEAVVLKSLGPSSGPDILLFVRFRKAWPSLNKEGFKVADDPILQKIGSRYVELVLSFAEKQLDVFQPRDDYKELLTLVIMFLGGIPKNGINFMAPAGLHRARWMAKGIYAIKVYMFRGEFKMTKKEEVAITELCMFVVSIYVYHWFQAPSCRFAPRNDLKLLKDLKAYNKVNEAIAEVALKNFSGHLWYLSEVLVAFAFFDENVPLETKTKMVQALENEGQEDTLRRITIDSRVIEMSSLEDFVSQNTRKFFSITGLSPDFLERERFKCLEHGCDDLRQSSTATLTQRGPRTECAVAKSGKFTSLLPLLLENQCGKEKLNDIVKLECGVEKIDYSNPGKIKLTTNNGDFECDLVLVTLPLAVLKAEHTKLFYPSLPAINVEAMKNLEMGTVDKIYLKFPQRWWPLEDFSGFCFATQPDQNTDDWENSLIAVIADESAPSVLCGWIVGDCARRMENCSDEEVVERVTRILRKHLDGHYKVPVPNAILRSKWHSNRAFRGSYTYYVDSCRDIDATEKLCTPVANAGGKPAIFFAGEATSKRDFSTAHGAIESGWREARRIIEIYSKPDAIHHKIVIVGAGLAGLAAAKTLVSGGIDDFKILEAQDYPGGRVMTEIVQNGVIELGAQWAHVSTSRMVEFAKEFGLASPIESSEGSGAYYYPGGREIPAALVEEIQNVVSAILENCAALYGAEKGGDVPATVGEFLGREFEKYLKSCDDSEEDDRLKRDLFDWHVRFQLIDNSCDRLDDLSARLWGQFGDSGSEQEHVNLAGGFSRLVTSLVELLPSGALMTSCPVTRVFRDGNCRIVCEDGRQYSADYVLITSSIGFLRENGDFFEPPLPEKYRNAIENIGFGTVNKIFLFYDDPWWGDLQGIQLVWNSSDKLNKFANGAMSWVDGLTGFDTVTSCDNVLLGWVGGRGAKECENLSENEIGSHCTAVLRHFTGRPTVPEPSRVIRSKWNSNRFVRGAYSHLTSNSSDCQDILSEPLNSIDDTGQSRPSLFFAGEALHKKYYSTANGAFDSGEFQANRILDYLQK
ncbi:Flavin containing amine oxidoreductase [Nesidiocoris tenuis]|uniref:Flavin containing amine oxidoreductase n=1 Tax=Nesidiocoris tenuis TaxID=355587 RepID=A0ABN7BBG6_9HEMI|nr:Flavin containing amine oxidoreductase [Nesidiocoris tenuis]